MDRCSNCNILRQFNHNIKDYRKDLFDRFYNRFNHAEVLQQSVDYLDLAVPSSRMNLKRQARNLVHRNMPYPWKEFFLAETIPESHEVASLYDPTNLLGTFYDRFQLSMETILISFEKKIFLGISEKDPDEKKRVIQKYLRAYRFFPIKRFNEKFAYLINLCLNPPLDCELTVDLLTAFCDTSYKQLSVFYLFPIADSLENLILHAKNMRFDFWGLWGGDGSLASEFDFITNYGVLNFSPEFSKILLKFGFPYKTGPKEYTLRCFRLKRIKFESRKVIRSVRVFFEHIDSEKRTRMMLIMDTFLTFGNFGRVKHSYERLETLKYLTRSLPLPYVSLTELYSTMRQAVEPDFEPHLSRIICKYASTYIFEDDIKILMPRRLMHLCRVAVRKTLADNFMLLDGIQELPIPDLLKRYLELES